MQHNMSLFRVWVTARDRQGQINKIPFILEVPNFSNIVIEPYNFEFFYKQKHGKMPHSPVRWFAILKNAQLNQPKTKLQTASCKL